MATDQQLRTDETGQLIAADKVEGTVVYNRTGEKLGTVKNIMIHKLSGNVAHAVMSFGGFLGMGEKYHALPCGVLTYDTNMGGYVVGIDKSRLEGAPVLAVDETSRLEDEAQGRQLHDYYGTRPYWGDLVHRCLAFEGLAHERARSHAQSCSDPSCFNKDIH